MQGLMRQQDNQSLAQAPTPQEDQMRKRQMQDAWKAYRGEFTKPLKVEADQPDDNVISNRCAPIVDKGVSFLFGQPIKIEAVDEATDSGGTPSPNQDFIDSLWGDEDDKMTLLSNLAINGGVCGQPFIKLIPARGGMKYPRIVVMDPQIVRKVTPPDDCDLTLAFVVEYQTLGNKQHRQIIARIDPDGMAVVAGAQDIDDTWTITDYERKGVTDSWTQVSDPVDWLYPFPPIFDCQNLPNPNEAWGKPDLTPDLIGLNKVLNFIQSNTSRIIKYHGHPVSWAAGLAATQVEIAVNGLICLPSPDSKLGKLDAMENFAGLLSVADAIRDDMDEQSRVPAVALGRLESLPRGSISGVALQLLFQPLIEKTVQKQRLYGRLIREVTRAALVLANKISIDQYEDFDIDIHWQNLLPIDDLAAAQTAQILQAIGVSNTTLMQKLGYDPEDEGKKNDLEDVKKVQKARAFGLPAAPQQPAPQKQSPFLGAPDNTQQGE